MQREASTAETAFTPWYAVYTRHQHEKTVAQGLTGKRFEVFLPLYAASRRWKDRVARISLPLFPGYVFLRGDLERRLDILSTPGVHFLLSVGGQPAGIPCSEVEAIRRVVEARLSVEPHPFLECGDKVRVRAGALEGIEGIVVRTKGCYRLVLSVELLEKSVAVEVESATVERLPSGRSPVNRHWPEPAFGAARSNA